MEPEESHLSWLSMGEESKKWQTDMIHQPEEKLHSNLGLYMLLSVMVKGGQGPYCVVVMNHGDKKFTLRKGSLIGKLYTKESVPKEVEFITDVAELTSLVEEKYINQCSEEGGSEGSMAPYLIIGAMFVPTYEALETVGVQTTRAWGSAKKNDSKIYSVYNVTEVNEKECEVNPELTGEQQEAILEILKHRRVFATSLKDVAELKAEPYVIKLKEDGKPVRVKPRMVPYESNQCFKEYIDQILELVLIARCDGPWAAGVVLVPSDIDKRAPKWWNITKLRKVPKSY